ncbi:MAG: hypothetical protein KDA85_05565, partial [Planctomycetaceae bacterium]|nr:hypothetical protein [Planctomycetaceae bacterium]
WREIRGTMMAGWPLHAFCCAAFVFGTPLVLAFMSGHDRFVFFVWVEIILTIITLLMVIALACRMFAGERERQTLDSLLTVPLTNRELLRQKQAAIHRMLLLLIPLFAIHLCLQFLCVPFYEGRNGALLTAWGWSGGRHMFLLSLQRLAGLFLHAFIFLSHLALFITLVKWIATGWGLWFRSQIKAILASLLSIAAICIVPCMLLVILMLITDLNPDSFPPFFFSTPVIIFGMNSAFELREVAEEFSLDSEVIGELVVTFVNLLIWGGLTLCIRQYVLFTLTRQLQRFDHDQFTPSMSDFPLTLAQGNSP